ncbi:MAG: hypothetical protein QHH27_06940 [Clostridia bacterium]|jgi:hypothetical protein|nr:hypothetical protein [Clostridia bacterium]MDH7573265.1 hypothetical protein [Clostridia bacterium]
MAEVNLKEMAALIQNLRESATQLSSMSEIPAVVRNCERILASVRMLELNINEALWLVEDEKAAG